MSKLVSLMDALVEHWRLVEQEEGAPFVLQDGTTRDLALQLRNEAAAAMTAIVAPENEREGLQYSLQVARRAVMEKATRFRAAVRYLYPNSPYARSLPRGESPTAATAKLFLMGEATAALWQTIDDSGTPLVVDGETQADFAGHVANLISVWTQLSEPRIAEGLARQDRRTKSLRLVALIKLYRQAIPVHFGPNSVFARSLPRLSRPSRSRRKKTD
jgi:hypothetical protein